MKTFPCSPAALGRRRAPRDRAFTMVEIALCLAIIGFALVALIGILPAGLNVQKENREETVIANDAASWLSAIRGGDRVFGPSLGHVIALTNRITEFDPATGNPIRTYTSGVDGESLGALQRDMVRILSTPRIYVKGGILYSNSVTAYVRALTAPAVNLAPQANDTILNSAFSYTITADVTPVPQPLDTTSTNYLKNLQGNLHEVQLTFRWPLLPTARTGNNRRTFRTTVGGELKSLGTLTVAIPGGQWTAEQFAFQPGTYVRK